MVEAGLIVGQAALAQRDSVPASTLRKVIDTTESSPWVNSDIQVYSIRDGRSSVKNRP